MTEYPNLTPSQFAEELIGDAPCGIAVTDDAGRLLFINSTLARWLRKEDIPVDGTFRFADLLSLPGKIFYETHMAPMLNLQGFIREISCDLRIDEDNTLPILLNGVSRRDDDGKSVRFDFTLFDARERRIYEEELRRAKREADELAAIVRSSPNAILRVDGAGHIEHHNAGAGALIRPDLGDVVGMKVSEAIRLADQDNWFDTFIQAHTLDGLSNFEATHEFGIDLEISLAPIDEFALPSDDRDWSIVLEDISFRKRAERHLNVVVDETKHRLRNTISVISGIARQTLEPEARKVFVSRLQALSHAHDVLTRTNWTAAKLAEILKATMTEAGGPQRFSFTGPDVWLSAQQTTSLSMAFHELTTNAMKYGALSNKDGSVEVTYDWLGEPGESAFYLQWQESGGPAVATPTRKGFGTAILTDILKAELDGEVDLEFRPEGLCLRVKFVPG